MQYPGQAHMDAALHLLAWYIRSGYPVPTRGYTPQYSLGIGRFGLGTDVDSRRSHTGYIIMLNVGAVSWKSHHSLSFSLFLSPSAVTGGAFSNKLSCCPKNRICSPPSKSGRMCCPPSMSILVGLFCSLIGLLIGLF